MPGLLIDDSGKVWPAQPETVAGRFDRRRKRHLALWATALGFIFVCFGECGAQVAFRPHFVTREAELRLCDILSKRSPHRIALAADQGASLWDLIIGPRSAIARIEQLIAEARNPSPRPLLTIQRLPLERSHDIARGELLPVLRAWHQMQGRWEGQVYRRLREWGLLTRTLIKRQPRASERLLIEHWGIGITTYGREWIRIAPGRDVEEQPNAALGRWRAAMQKQVIAEAQPRLTASDVVFRQVDGTLVRSQTSRLDLPWHASGGDAITTGILVERRTSVLERPNPAN